VNIENQKEIDDATKELDTIHGTVPASEAGKPAPKLNSYTNIQKNGSDEVLLCHLICLYLHIFFLI
jgi:hypothetical protein